MTIIDLLSRLKLSEIQKYSVGFALLIMGWLVGHIIESADKKDEVRIKQMENAIAYYQSREQKREKQCDSLVSYWQRRYTQVVEQNTEYFRQQDSINRAALQIPSVKILKSIK